VVGTPPRPAVAEPGGAAVSEAAPDSGEADAGDRKAAGWDRPEPGLNGAPTGEETNGPAKAGILGRNGLLVAGIAVLILGLILGWVLLRRNRPDRRA
jgi:hypothetical protein